jgi:hypothetical protein
MAQDFLQDLDDHGKANAFILAATTPNTSEINRTRVASQIYLAYKTRVAGESLAIAVKSMADELDRALTHHAEALKAAATPSEKYARGLNRATRALVGVTAALVFVTCLQVWRGH